jgi:hypothetical protein
MGLSRNGKEKRGDYRKRAWKAFLAFSASETASKESTGISPIFRNSKKVQLF